MPFALSTSKRAAILALGAFLLLGAGQAFAHAQLMHADPAPNATVGAPGTIMLHFNEALEPRLSNFRITDEGGKTVAVTPASAGDNKALAATPAQPLAPGRYTVSWVAVGSDGHPMRGTYSFTVR